MTMLVNISFTVQVVSRLLYRARPTCEKWPARTGLGIPSVSCPVLSIRPTGAVPFNRLHFGRDTYAYRLPMLVCSDGELSGISQTQLLKVSGESFSLLGRH